MHRRQGLREHDRRGLEPEVDRGLPVGAQASVGSPGLVGSWARSAINWASP